MGAVRQKAKLSASDEVDEPLEHEVERRVTLNNAHCEEHVLFGCQFHSGHVLVGRALQLSVIT